MSVSEPSTHTQPSPPTKLELKSRPPIPKKPSPSNLRVPLSPQAGSPTSGKVKHIVNKFSQQVALGHSRSTDCMALQRKTKRAPTVKPRPHKSPANTERVPSWPPRRSRVQRKSNEKPAGAEALAAPEGQQGQEGRRPAPEGKEVETPVVGTATKEAELGLEGPVAPACERDCSCICHLNKPGMRLVWVPLAKEKEKHKGQDGNENEEEDNEEWESVGEEHEETEEVGENGATSSGAEERRHGGQATGSTGRVKFQHSLDYVVKRRSLAEVSSTTEPTFMGAPSSGTQSLPLPPSMGAPSPGAQCLPLAATTGAPSSGTQSLILPPTTGAPSSGTQNLPLPPSMDAPSPGAQSLPQPPTTGALSSDTQNLSLPPSSGTCEEEEDSIYEDVLDIAHVPPVSNAAQECKQPSGIPRRKPLRLCKVSRVAPEVDAECPPEPPAPNNDPPPAIPPRMPLVQDRPKSPRLSTVPRGIPLPMPSVDEWRMLRSLPPPSTATDHSQGGRAQSQAGSTLLPHAKGKEPSCQFSPEGSSLISRSAQSAQSAQCSLQLNNKEGKGGNDVVDVKKEEPPPVVPRMMSKDWRSQFQNEPLYQTYRSTVITKEIRRQTVCRNISKTTADYRADLGASQATAMVPNGGPSQSTLWQNLPPVRDSGILAKLSPAELKYQESMFEVLTSEASYLRSLRVLTDHFLDSRELDETLIILDKKRLFSNILRVREVSERFLMDLELRINSSLVISDICDIIHYHAQHNFPAYMDYVRNQVYQEKTYANLMQKNAQFAAVITRLQESPQCQRLPFTSFLLLPFQRITRIRMLIENILKRTTEGTKEELSASKALFSVSKIIDDCNTEVGKMKQMEELIDINKMLEFEKLRALPIISQNRFLEKQGELQEMAKGGTLFNLRPKFTPIYLFLFNDLLILASRKSSERYVVIDHTHRSLVQVQPMSGESPGPAFENCFCLTLLENHQGRTNERLLKAETRSDRDRWLEAFPDPDRAEKDTDDVVYEDWDCPQVHCIEQYVAMQADELNLEPMDIINVLRKTNEGWYQGIKLSDGQKGWFPVTNVQEITNEHVRRRNLRERYRVMQAAHAATKSRTGP